MYGDPQLKWSSLKSDLFILYRAYFKESMSKTTVSKNAPEKNFISCQDTRYTVEDFRNINKENCFRFLMVG